MEPERRRQIDRAEAAGYLPQLRALAKRTTVPIWWWSESLQIDKSILHNGTFCAVDTGSKTVCVTADHVYAQYLADTEKYGDIECQIGNVRIRLEDYVIDRDSTIDLATFDVSPILIAGSQIEAHAAHKWPPSSLKEKEIVALGGYPGSFRRERSTEVDFSFVTFFVPVAQASEGHSAFQLNLKDSYWPDGSGGVPERSELGGMSGGPIFRYHPGPIEFLELAGFVYQANSEFGLIRGRHASCVSRAGGIEHGA